MDEPVVSIEGQTVVETLVFKTTYGTLVIYVFEQQPYLAFYLTKKNPSYKRSTPFTKEEVLQEYGYIIDQIPEFVPRDEALTKVTMTMNDFVGFF